MNQEKVAKAIQSAVRDNRITCEKAHELARSLDVSLREIGEICDALHIKISHCQLGCF